MDLIRRIFGHVQCVHPGDACIEICKKVTVMTTGGRETRQVCNGLAAGRRSSRAHRRQVERARVARHVKLSAKNVCLPQVGRRRSDHCRRRRTEHGIIYAATGTRARYPKICSVRARYCSRIASTDRVRKGRSGIDGSTWTHYGDNAIDSA